MASGPTQVGSERREALLEKDTVGIALAGIYGFGAITRPDRCRARLGPDSILALVVFAVGIAGLFFVGAG